MAADRDMSEVHTGTCTAATAHTDISVSSRVIREGNQYCHTGKSEQRKGPK